MEDIDYEKIFVRTVTLYDVDREWVRLTHTDGTTVDRGTGCSGYVNAITSHRGSANGGTANGGSDCNH